MAKQSIFVSAGQRFGHCSVINPDGYCLNKQGHRVRTCRLLCDCGNEFTANLKNVTSGNTTTCGCGTRKATTERNYRHGYRRTKLYDIWTHMKDRCSNPNCQRYARYGGRGIAVCPEWEQSFFTFKEWAIAANYTDGLSLDRIDINGNYTPENCRFVPLIEQMRNTSHSVKLTYLGETKVVAEWARDPRCPVSEKTLARRIRAGWPVDEAISTVASLANRKHRSSQKTK